MMISEIANCIGKKIRFSILTSFPSYKYSMNFNRSKQMKNTSLVSGNRRCKVRRDYVLVDIYTMLHVVHAKYYEE